MKMTKQEAKSLVSGVRRELKALPPRKDDQPGYINLEDLSHNKTAELIARAFGSKNWSAFNASLNDDAPAPTAARELPAVTYLMQLLKELLPVAKEGVEAMEQLEKHFSAQDLPDHSEADKALRVYTRVKDLVAAAESGAPPAPRKVWVTNYEHRFGNDIYVYDSLEAAIAARADVADMWWDGEIGADVPKPLDGDIGEEYFNRMSEYGREESFSIDETTIIGS